MVDLLDCTVMPYAWGSLTAIAELTGRPASATPEAELWMGAHPMAPSRIGGRSLIDVIADDPAAALGARVETSLGPALPFLLKVLAAGTPLSLQAHPTTERARAGFAEEDARGIPRGAPARNYRDASHKPELLCALTPFDALCGFRRAADTLRLFEQLHVSEKVIAPLREAPDPSGLARTFAAIMTLLADEGAALVRATVERCHDDGEFAAERRWAIALDALYPGDVGVVSALLLNLLHLEPGQAIYLGAGNLHAYLGGVGVEIMASSDNVLRGGLTRKHVDVPELLRVLDFSDGPVAPLAATPIDESERAYLTPAAEFRLSVIEVAGLVERAVHGPEILLCTRGSATVTPADGSPPRFLGRGGAAFVPASTGRYVLSADRASLYRATVNLT